MMSLASHPYAAASTSSPLKRASRAAKRPSISSRPMSYLPDLEEEDDGVSRTFFDNDSPLGKLANLSLDKASKRASRPRPVGLNGTERMSIQMVFEAGPSSSSQLISPVDTVNIDGLSLDFPRPPLTSPSPSVSTSPSTPGMPLTPSSSDSEHETFEKAIKPLTVASKSTPEKSKLSRHDTATRRVFAPLDTVAANKLSLGLDPELELSLTGMLEEMRERKAGQVEDDDDESAWIDEDEDEYAAHDYYRADIATHLDIFSPLTPSSGSFSLSPRSSLRHRRQQSSSSSQCAYLSPARPDSMPPPPHFAKNSPISSFRRTSASSLASTVSNSSVRSNGSRTSKNKRTSNRVRASIARNMARRSSMTTSAKSNANANTSKDLPPTPHTANTNFGPSPFLDPSFPRRRPSFTPPARAPPPPPPSSFRMAKRSTRPPPRSSLPVDIDFDVGEDDDLVDFVDPFQDGFVEIVCPDDMAAKEDPISPLDGASLPFSPSSLSLDLGAPSVMQSDCSPAPDTVSFLSSDPYDSQSHFDCNEEYEPDRALRSRWSMSTLGSIEPPASSARSLFPAIPKLFQSKPRTPKPESPKKEKEVKPKKQRESSSTEPPRGFPFFPQPTPPSPKRKTTLGPGPFKYNGPPPPSSSSPSKSSFISSMAPSSPGPSPSAKKVSHSPSPSASSQYINYTPQHKQKASVSTPASSDAQSSFSFAMSASSSTHRFLPGSPSRGLRRSNSRASTNSDMSGTSRGSCESGSSTGSSGLRRKPIPVEIFMR
ncbi:hypothetical protein SCHPADRAFT_930775 [Schizopora paradoxa]|uniref:Uncharacterized protein n=1 Tax=Schizopora paradoxa TaxID=27342 RepID=A0A0H2RE44_9AGAM|nr:hypothetical protein SCHPADRAFT_930775 [Schizopora paradoxa]